jgi:hypothetical protein
MRSRRITAVVTVLATAAAAAGITGAFASRQQPDRAAARRALSIAPAPCGKLSARAARYTHVLWILMENHSYGTIIGSAQAPYINGLARECGLATNYHNISHPSLPNYVAATSGLGLAALSPFTSDCSPSPSCSTSAPSIFGETKSWRSYEESMPSDCDRADAGEYAVRHNPAVYYTKLAGCAARDVPYTVLASDLAHGTLPAFSFVTPNLIDDMHDGTIVDGDAWLSRNVPPILGSSLFKTGRLAVFITWDEGEGGASDNCAADTTDVGCHVATLVLSASTKAGTRSGRPFNHYALLASTEKLLRLRPLGQARAAASVVAAFHL